jgi:thiol-disulfide isomerase/thioredoxin
MKIVIKNDSLVKELGFEDFDEITKSNKPYVIVFTNPTCHLCKALKPIYKQIAEEYSKYFNFANINTRKERKMSEMFKIDGVPEMFIIDSNELYNIKYPEDPDENSGYSKEYITKHLDGFIDMYNDERGC